MERNRMMRRTLSAAAVTAALLVQAGCGGGGGGGGSTSQSYPLSIRVNQNPISATFALFDLPNVVVISATVRGSTSATTLYVAIADPKGTFAGARNLSQSAPGEYSIELPLTDGLAVGTHAGSLQISVCSDAGCGNVLGRTDAPYSILITENPVATGNWSRDSVALAAIQGDEPATWSVTLLNPKLSYVPYARFSDPDGIVRIAGDSQTIMAPFESTPIGLVVSSAAPVGTHVGNLEMVYCRDAACTQSWGGVTRLPYTVTVYPATNLKPLVGLSGVPDWTTFQGAAARTGHVQATLDPADFSPRWRWSSPDPGQLPEILDPVSSAGRVFTIAAPIPTNHLTPILFALDEATGSAAWQQPLPDSITGPTSLGLGPLTTPAIAGDAVFVASTVSVWPPTRGRFFGFRVADGASVFAAREFDGPPGEFTDPYRDVFNTFGTRRAAYLTPRGGSLLLARGPYSHGFIGDLDPADGSDANAAPACPSANNVASFAGAIAVDANGRSYATTNDGLLLLDTCEVIPSPQVLVDGPGPAVVPGASSVVVTAAGNLVSFDPVARTIKWSVPASATDFFGGSPAIVGTTIYVYNAGYADDRNPRLEARRESDGAVLWSWQSPWEDDTSFPGNVVATDNLVFVGTTKRVFAIDVATHQAVWVYPYPGRLALSASGLLYIRRTTDGGQSLAAINVR